MTIRSLHGRFNRVSSFENKLCIVVGFVGNVYPHNLTPEQLKYIRWFYHIPATWAGTVTNKPTDCRFPANNYTGFIEFAPVEGGAANG